MKLTAVGRSAFEKQMATALIECPCGTANMKRTVAGQMHEGRWPFRQTAVGVGSSSYRQGDFNRPWMELN
jgi:hypothetical protein